LKHSLYTTLCIRPKMPLGKIIVDYVESASPTELFVCASYIVGVIMFALIFWYIFESTKEDVPVEESNTPVDEMELFKNYLANHSLGSGSTDRYSWTQNENEIDLHLPIGHLAARKIQATDVNVEFGTMHIKVDVCEKRVLDDTLSAAVRPQECSWQLDEVKGEQMLWITLAKRVPSTNDDPWQYILGADRLDDDAHPAQ
jgi:CS domain